MLANDEEGVAKTVFDNQPAGIYPFGSIEYTVKDRYEYEQIVRFSYATATPIYVYVNLLYEPDYIGDLAVQGAVSKAGSDTSTIGQDVYTIDLLVAAAAIQGVRSLQVKVSTDPTAVGFPLHPSWEDVQQTINQTNIATYSTANVWVVSNPL